ncbi:MAG: hypothetical protein O7G29_14235 [Acidobacteria bacterium]|nr:hypothetical protein [Acidobacteriota bacterium]
MKSKLLTILVVLCLGLSLSAVIAQTPADGQLVRVLQIHVKPGMAAQYEEARKDVIAHLASNRFSYPFSVSRDESLVYRNITQIDNGADLDKRSAEFARIMASLDSSISRRLDEAIDHLTHWTFRTRPDLAYAPENPRLSPEDVGLHHYAFLYLRPGTGTEAADALKNLRELWTKHAPGDALVVAQAVTGPDLPMLLVRIPAKDAADHYAQSDRIQNAAGEEYQRLLGQLRRTYRRLEQSNNTVVPGLSYQPELPTN